MKYKKGLIFICLIICLFSIASVVAGDVNETIVASENQSDEVIGIENQNEEVISVEESKISDENKLEESVEIFSNFNKNEDKLGNDKNEGIVQSKENEYSYSSIDETNISSSMDKLGTSVTWSGKDTETFHLSLLSNNYVQPSSSQQIIVQRIHNTEENYYIDILYYILNSNGDIVYQFVFPNTRNYQIVYFESNANVFSNLPDGTYKCAISERAIENMDDYNRIPGYYAIKWEVVKKSTASQSSSKTPIKTTLALKTIKVKKSAKKLVLQATLKQGNKALSGKKITFKFNGKKYTAKTNKKGIAKVTIKKSVLKKLKAGKKVTYQVTYLKDTVKRSVKVKK